MVGLRTSHEAGSVRSVPTNLGPDVRGGLQHGLGVPQKATGPSLCVASPAPHPLCRILTVTLAHQWRHFPSPQCACGDELREYGDLPYQEAHARHVADILATEQHAI